MKTLNGLIGGSNGPDGTQCLTCRFWHALDDASGIRTAKTDGECHARTPRAQMVPNHGGFAFVAAWPPVSGGDWCGEHSQLAARSPQSANGERDASGFPRSMKATGEPDQKLRGE